MMKVIFVLGRETVIVRRAMLKFTFDTSVTLVCDVPVILTRAAAVIDSVIGHRCEPSLAVEAAIVSHEPEG